ncbi:hypothetical protein Tco_1510389, partial [Tanacetum coccineum]
MVFTRGSCRGQDMALPPRDQRHQYLKFEGLKYTDADITDFEDCLGKIYYKGIHRVLILDFESLSAAMAEGLTRMLMEHRDLGRAKRCMSWRQFILDLRLYTAKEMETAGFGLYWAESARQIFDKGDLSAYWRGISSKGDFLGVPPSYTHIRDPMLRL